MNEKTRDFIEQNIDADVRQLALKGCRDKEVDFNLALRQIAGQQKARLKLPSWAATDGLLYPQHLSLEQCSSEQTALYKVDLCRRLNVEGERLVDLTGGFGVDISFMSKAFREAVYVEQNEALYDVVAHNMRLLAHNVTCKCGDGVDVLHQLEHATMIYMDPARRDAHGARTYGIGDCTPNVLELRDELLQKADVVMLKLSPMLDWRKAVEDLGRQHVCEVHIVATQNECKELVVVMRQEADRLQLYCVNDGQTWQVPTEPTNDFELPENNGVEAGCYLYEPNASIMKAGCFAEVEKTFSVRQLAPNSHLFASFKACDVFPGRRFRVTAITTMNKKELKAALSNIGQANITVRNFPLTAVQLRQRLKLKDGGNNYIFGTTLRNGQHTLLICERAS
ncbi:MAG: SAM-dependent methyltransferase [Prevotella sp.]|nr:SAM-dependent methyltransferase [Prevotella sp.]